MNTETNKDEKKIRDILPCEVEIRKKGKSKDGKWTTWFLYKTARVDSAVLTETFGLFGWQNKFERIGNTLFCSIGVQDPETGNWIWKSDAGDETQVEAVKGEASDAFKRAGFKWGIGVQLYNVPDIILDSKYEHVKIKEIALDNEKVTKLVLTCKGEEVYWFPHRYEPKASVKTVEVKAEETDSYKALLAEAEKLNMDMNQVHAWVEKKAGISQSDPIPENWLADAIKRKKDALSEKASTNENK